MIWRSAIALAVCLPLIISNGGQAQERRRQWDPGEFLRRLDRNGNGILEPDEMLGRAKGFVEGLGIDASGAVPIETVLNAIDRQRQEADADRAKKEAERATAADWSSPRLVPGFGEASQAPAVSGFGSGDSDSASTTAPVGDDEVSESLREQVDRVLNQYDQNKDQVLDAGEIKNTPWGQPSPQESDTNGDGRLTREELIDRYRKREADSARMNGDRESSRQDSTDRRSDRTSNPAPKNSTVASTERPDSSRSSSQQDRIADYVRELLGKYDSDNDGSISTEEQANMKSAIKGADSDSNGMLSRDELINYYGGGYRQPATGDPQAPNDSSSPSGDGDSIRNERRRESRNNRESSRESNTSGQRPVKMHEFTDTWTDEKLAEFRELDLNHDGVISVEEFRLRQ